MTYKGNPVLFNTRTEAARQRAAVRAEQLAAEQAETMDTIGLVAPEPRRGKRTEPVVPAIDPAPEATTPEQE